MKMVLPKVFLVGYTDYDLNAIKEYLKHVGAEEFLDELNAASVSTGEAICSMFAKLCYKSLVVGANANITRVRGIEDNLRGTIDSGHGSVFEHFQLNFVITDCSRVFTHELVRHRVGTAFSQTSGRYVRGDISFVFDPILEPARADILRLLSQIEGCYRECEAVLGLDTCTDMTLKKQLTSALRRILPNGQSNEIGFSCNIRTLRHTLEMRTSRHAEWEIRYVYNQIYEIIKLRYPLMLYGGSFEVVNGLVECTNLRI